MNTKKIFIIASIVFVLLVGSILVYNLVIKKTYIGDQTGDGGALPSSSPGDITGSGLPTDTIGGTGPSGSPGVSLAGLKLKPISSEPVLAPTIGADGKTVKYYVKSNGNVFESNFDGDNKKKISSTNLTNILKIIWSPNKEKVIGIFNENNQPKKYLFDYVSGQTALLGAGLGYISWSPDGKQIAYQYSSATEEQSNISTANPDGTGWKNIFKTRLENLIVEWPIKEKISIRTPVSGLAQGLLYAINSQTGAFTKVLSDIYGLNTKWSPKADKILFSFTSGDGKNPALMLADETGSQTKDLKVAGLVDKCVWSLDDRTVFCALPQEISPNATWPDDYYKGLVIVKDDFYKINLETNERTKITGSSLGTGYDAQELFLSPKEDYLFFINRIDGLLYSLKL
jgi:hypothetical protein